MSHKCPKCNEQLVSTDVFCPYCGVNTKESDSSRAISDSQIDLSSCPSCGTVIELGLYYCNNCGSSLLSNDAGVKATQSEDFTNQNYTYGSATDNIEEDKRPWYKPPKRERSAKDPREWFFWTGWGLFFLLRVVFQILIIILQVAARSKK